MLSVLVLCCPQMACCDPGVLACQQSFWAPGMAKPFHQATPPSCHAFSAAGRLHADARMQQSMPGQVHC